MRDKHNAAGERKPAAVLKYDLQVKILAACDQREATPQEFADPAGGVTLANVNYHFSELAKWGFIYVTKKEPSGGSERCYYRSLRQGVVSDEEFAELDPERRMVLTGAVVEAIAQRAHDAVQAETIDKHANSHITWDAEWLDPERFDLLMAKLMEVHEFFNQLKRENAGRPVSLPGVKVHNPGSDELREPAGRRNATQRQAAAGPSRREGAPETAGLIARGHLGGRDDQPCRHALARHEPGPCHPVDEKRRSHRDVLLDLEKH